MRPYECTVCGKLFSTSGNKHDHERRHAGVKPYLCPVAGCNMAYYRKYELVKHGSSIKHKNLMSGFFEFLMSDKI
jgi:zinc finger protein GLIS2